MKQQKGFSLPELMVVMVLIGVLSSIAIPKIIQGTVKAKVIEVKVQARYFQDLAEFHYNIWGEIPTSVSDLSFSTPQSLYFEYQPLNQSEIIGYYLPVFYFPQMPINQVFAAAKVTLCHIPPGNPENAQTLSISESALKTHEDHHDDYLGACITPSSSSAVSSSSLILASSSNEPSSSSSPSSSVVSSSSESASSSSDLLSSSSEDSSKKVTICHIPPGNPENAQTITISENALKTHEDCHDDYVGECIASSSSEQSSSAENPLSSSTPISSSSAIESSSSEEDDPFTHKTTLCHNNSITISFADPEMAQLHLGHGDTVGECSEESEIGLNVIGLKVRPLFQIAPGCNEKSLLYIIWHTQTGGDVYDVKGNCSNYFTKGS